MSWIAWPQARSFLRKVDEVLNSTATPPFPYGRQLDAEAAEAEVAAFLEAFDPMPDVFGRPSRDRAEDTRRVRMASASMALVV